MDRFATMKAWLADGSVIDRGDKAVVIPDGYSASEGVFDYKVGTGDRSFRTLPFEPGRAFFVISSSSGGDVTIANVPLPVTSTSLALETTQVDVKDAVERFQFDLSGNLKTTGGGGGVVDQGAPGLLAWPVSGPLTDAQLRAAAVPVSTTALPLPTGAATEVTAQQISDRVDLTNTLVGNMYAGVSNADMRFATQEVRDKLIVAPATEAKQTQPGVDIGDVTVNNASGADAVNIQDGGNSITVDGAVMVSNALDLSVTAVGTVGAAVTATLPAVAASYHLISSIEITMYTTAARTGNATPVTVTSTNLSGSIAWTFPTAAAIGTTAIRSIDSATPIRSSVVNTNTTIVCPAATSVIWRVNVFYRTSA